MKKTIIVHVDQYLDNPEFFEDAYKHKPSLKRKINNMRKVILDLLKKEEEIYHINQFSDFDKLDQHKALYILNNGTNVRDIARKIIEKGDSVILAGIYRDACLISIQGVAERIGASTIIHKRGSLSSDDFLH